MNFYLKGKVLQGGALDKYSEDRSPYKVMPQLATQPKDEDDIKKVIEFAKKNNLPVTARGAGSNLCGSCLGSGIVVDVSRLTCMAEHGKNIDAEPGVIYDDLNKKASVRGFFLPYSPSSGAFCTIGGNVSTKAAGYRSVKYGSVDNFVKSLRYADARGRIIDTSGPLPPDLEKRILDLRKALLADKKTMSLLRGKEGMKTSSGYNIFALYKHSKAEDIATHLFVGAAGTLGIVTKIRLGLAPLPKKRVTCTAYFKTLEQACAFVLKIKKLGPSAVEILDAFSLGILREHSKRNIPKCEAALLIEFDSKFDIKILNKFLKSSLESQIEYDPKKQADIWNIRRDLLTIIEEKNKNVISFIEDIGVPPRHLAEFMRNLHVIFKKNGVSVVIFGHAGEGNLHMRPIVSGSSWKNAVVGIAEQCYRAAFRLGGTTTCEHGMGRNKSPYIREEWGPKVIEYFNRIKNVFDPDGIFNPDVNFDGTDITKDMKY